MEAIDLAELSSNHGNDNTMIKVNMRRRGKKIRLNPIDGRWAVLVAIAAFIGQAILGFVTYSLPMLSIEWEKRLGFTPSQVSWSITLVNAIRFCTAPVVGAFINRFGCRPVMFAGGILAMVFTILLSLAKELGHINICCAGIGIATGLANQGTIIIVSMYFDKWLGRANGFAQGGVGIGFMAGSPLMALLIGFYTWRGAVLIMAGISANFSVVATVYRPLSWWSNEQTLSQKNSGIGSPTEDGNEETDLMNEGSMMLKESHVDDVRSSCEKPAVKVCVNDEEIEKLEGHHCHEENIPSTLASKYQAVGKDRRDSSEQHQTNITEAITLATTEHSPETRKNIRIKRHARIHSFIKYLLNLFGFSLLWTNTNVLLLCLVAAFQGFGYFPTFIYLSSFIVSSGVSALKASFIFTIIGICSLIGRITHGFLVDFNFISCTKLFGLASMVAGSSVYILVFFGSYPAFAVFAVIFGLSSGTLVALVPVVTKKYTAPSELVNAFALQSFFVGVFQLIGTYFLGLLFDETNMYGPCFCFTGGLLCASGVIALLIEPLNRRSHRHRLVCC